MRFSSCLCSLELVMTDSRILGYDPNYGEVRMVTDCDDMTMERKIIPHRALVMHLVL